MCKLGIFNIICRDGGIGRHKGLKIPRLVTTVPVQVWFPASLGCPILGSLFFKEPLKTSVFRGNSENATFKSP